MILKNPDFRKLYETDKYIAGNEFEYAYLVNKETMAETYMGSFYGDPKCGLIDANNSWCLIAGHTIHLLKTDSELIIIDKPELNWVTEMRQKSPSLVELLIDPWSDFGAVWAFHTTTIELTKLKTLNLSNQPYIDKVEW